MEIFDAIKKEGFGRRLSPRTIKAYVYWVKRFLTYSKKDHNTITKKDVREYIEYLSEKKHAGSTLNVALNSIFFLTGVMNKNWKLNIKYSKRPKSLPTFLSRQEVSAIISCIYNEKHKLMVELMYSAGLRVSELVNLRVKDLELDHGWVRHGKGDKDRPFIVAERLEGKLKHWICSQKLTNSSYLFKGNNGWHLSKETVLRIVKNASKKAEIQKNVHPHTFRHSFATHIIENGYSAQTLQGLLGHSSLDTSLNYVHCAAPKMKVKSPYDQFT